MIPAALAGPHATAHLEEAQQRAVAVRGRLPGVQLLHAGLEVQQGPVDPDARRLLVSGHVAVEALAACREARGTGGVLSTGAWPVLLKPVGCMPPGGLAWGTGMPLWGLSANDCELLVAGGTRSY